MAAIYQSWGTSNQSVTITLNALAASATVGRQSTAITIPTTNVLDMLVFPQFVLATGTIGGTRAVYLFAIGTVDDGTTYTDGAGATDAAFTRTDPPNIAKLGHVNFTAQSQTKSAGPYSLAACFGGVLPARVVLAVMNDTNIALATSASNKILYQYVYGSSV